ncbi:MAG: thioredoxin domain-containing protein, partial [Bacteroidota bacterium]
MEHESFMDSTVAKLMNEKYICIKIDREERPDIDQIYMNAAMLISGGGGWPLNAFATPKGEPFYAGTYFPKNQWMDVLGQLAKLYEKEPEKIAKQAQSLTEGIQRYDLLKLKDIGKREIQKEDYVGIYENWSGIIDFQKGGFRRAPKFPLPAGWEFLLQYHYLTGNAEALVAVKKTLAEMARGGIYDQIGGGFARYSTDDRWFAPHFEKMLYDNGQLVSLYAQAYQVTNNPLYEAVIRETLAFVEREMSHPEGGFYASLNADSEGEEGKFYVWKASEFEAVLGKEKEALAREYFQVKKGGNWESGKNILIRKESPEAFAQKKGLNPDEWKNELGDIKKKLRAARAQKIRPSLDDKILTSWNALMLRGYIQAYRALGNPAYLERALQNAQFLEKNMLREEGRLWRNYKGKRPSIDAFLDDYALLARAWIELYQVTLDIHWLEKAKEIADYVIAHFRDE